MRPSGPVSGVRGGGRWLLIFRAVAPNRLHCRQIRKYPTGFVNYNSKMFYKICQQHYNHENNILGNVRHYDRCQCYKTFYGRKLRLFIKSQSVCPWQVFLAQSLQVRPGPTQVKHLSGPLQGRFLALRTNIRLGQKTCQAQTLQLTMKSRDLRP